MSEQVKHTLHWVQGNTVNFAIPLQQETQTPQGKVVEDYYPAVDDVVTVSMCGKYLSTQIPCTVDGNVVIANDNGTLKVDVYGVEPYAAAVGVYRVDIDRHRIGEFEICRQHLGHIGGAVVEELVHSCKAGVGGV